LNVSNQIKALKGEHIPEGVEEQDFIIKRMYDILSNLFSYSYELPERPKRILMLGLFGSGKTTTTIKLANYYKKKGQSVGIIAADTFRMAAYEQLKQYGQNFDVFGNVSKSASETITQGLVNFKDKDLIIVDSAGRSSFDEELSKELNDISSVFKPDLSILVLSADVGQIALNQAKEFNSIVPLKGIIITKMDGSAKGGGALAACSEINIPVLFIATGEKIEDLQQFEVMRYLSSMMGYGDLKGILERVQDADIQDIDPNTFDLNVFKKQIGMTKKIGSLGKIAGMLGFGKFLNKDVEEKAELSINKFGYMIDSMTNYERSNPAVIDGSRIRRISKGSGTKIEDVHMLLKQYKTMQDAFDKFKGKSPENLGQDDIQGLFKKQMQKKMKRKLKIR
jgi:signal recognition particle subunit SRP54